MITFKKGTYKIVGHFNPNDKTKIVAKPVEGLLFTYKGRNFGMSKKTYNEMGDLVDTPNYIVTDIETGMRINMVVSSKQKVEEEFEMRPSNFIDTITEIAQNEQIEEIKKIIKKSNLGKLLGA